MNVKAAGHVTLRETGHKRNTFIMWQAAYNICLNDKKTQNVQK